MGNFKKALHSKIDVFVKFESAINLEIRGQIKKKIGFLLFGLQGPYECTFIKIWVGAVQICTFLGDLRWNDPGAPQELKKTLIFFHKRMIIYDIMIFVKNEIKHRVPIFDVGLDV